MLGFLSLPREIRDMIYDFLFIRDEIEFEDFYTDETPEEWMQDRRPEFLTLRQAKPYEKPLLEHNGVGFVHQVEPLRPIDGRRHWDDVLYKDRQRSYRIFRGTIDPPCLRIFLANSIVYKEAAPMFYAKNVFTFPSKGCFTTLNACSAFISDRPDQSLPYIKSINLCIGHSHSSRIDGEYIHYGAHYPTVKHLSEILRLNVHLDHLRLLVEEQIPTDEMVRTIKTSLGYIKIFHWVEAFNLNGTSITKTLEIEFTDSLRPDLHKVWMEALVYRILDNWTLHRFTYFISFPNVRNEKGKEMASTRVVYQHPTKAGSSGLS